MASIENKNVRWRIPKYERRDDLVIQEASDESRYLIWAPMTGFPLKVGLAQLFADRGIRCQIGNGEFFDGIIRRGRAITVQDSEIFARDHRI